MRVTTPPSSIDSLEGTVQLHVLDDAFFLVNEKGQSLRMTFDGVIAPGESNWEPPKEDDVRSYEIYGVLGILQGIQEKFLVVITRVQRLGRIFGHPIYVIEQVVCLNFDAKKARTKLDSKTKSLNNNSSILSNDDTSNTDSSDDEDEDDDFDQRVTSPTKRNNNVTPTISASTPTTTTAKRSSSSFFFSSSTVLEPKEDQKRSASSSPSPTGRRSSTLMNRFRFSLSGSTTKKKLNNNYSDDDDDDSKGSSDITVLTRSKSLKTSSSSTNNDASSTQDLFAALTLSENIALDQRLVKQVTELFSRSIFIFSPTYDTTNSFQRTFDDPKSEAKKNIPLWKQVDKRFWWNEYISREFQLRNLDDWILPVMQGTMQIEPCEIEGCQFDFILISRRSRERAGMRYQRRGINEQGQVANFVETEQIIIFNRDDEPHVASFVQTRGSIPIFWSQSPYSLHPIPTLDRDEEENNIAFKRHFDEQEKLYGKQIAVSLTELEGREGIVGSEYRRQVEHLADPNIKYVEFDFHRETKGMRFENISKLSTSLRDDLTKLAHFWEAGTDTVYCRQIGVVRTNCMDCLDRTNVVQSAFARIVLNLQLMRFGITEFPDEGIRYYENFECIFNHVWANNGDMISRMYAGTSALKGDFTRTGKRNITGMMNDASNSLARMYLNTVKDFWRQATIDYVLGYHKVEIFRHVPKSQLMSAEPGVERRMAKIRMDAIEVSSAIVIEDDESKIAGWTLLSPNELQKRRAKKFEEKVVLLTEAALYICSYNYNLEKVVQFKRIPLDTITSIQVGEYILSSTTPASRDVDQNYGFLLYYDSNRELIRLNTGSIRNQSLGDLNISSTTTIHKEETRNHPPTSSSSSSTRSSNSHEESVDDDNEQEEVTQEKENNKKNSHHHHHHHQQTFVAFKGVRYNVLGELSEEEIKSVREQILDMTDQIVLVCGRKNDQHFLVQKPVISLEQAEDTDGIFKKMGLKIKKAIWI
ncbi:SacI homology domain-containing protein [Phascolomyces articulosus]|uniref:SacI homology domain-containing protein n=1 Tax=Phascolomyces articulosus TaxID=60185 RepID=A0AAD5JT78_9FUNG|nr:SacI homology domain-containing protein [Phascolomyces articulosus]